MSFIWMMRIAVRGMHNSEDNVCPADESYKGNLLRKGSRNISSLPEASASGRTAEDVFCKKQIEDSIRT